MAAPNIQISSNTSTLGGNSGSVVIYGVETPAVVQGSLSITGNIAVTGTTTVTGSVISTGLAISSVTNAITAFATGGQASAVLLTSSINRVTTVTTAGDSVKLPVSVAGYVVTVINAAANSMDLFPNTGDAINAGAANAALAVAAGKTVILSCAVAGTWNAVVSA